MKSGLVVIRLLLAGLAIVSVVAVAGCRAPADVSAATIAGVDWHLDSDRNASFRIDDGELRGTDSCNQIFGTVNITEGDQVTIEFDALGSTRMACPDDTNAQEDMGRALVGERLVEQPDSDSLILIDASSGERWRFEK